MRYPAREFFIKNVYTVSKAAKKLGCHPNTIKRVEKRLGLNVERDYRNYRIYTEEIVNKIWKYMNSIN